LPPTVLARLIRVFSFDVDFQRDVQPDDSFDLMFERHYDDSGTPVAEGNILIAEMVLSGKRIRLYRHRTRDGDTDYYDEKGHSVRKALVLTPIDGARISSGFGRRRHPILGYTKMHRGIDFAAPRGTPVYAAGHGTVEAAGRNGGYGKYVRIRHKGSYKTAYAHLRGFARGVSRGRRVRQGQTIGYVGSTGRSTGPHLHYEILRNGRQMNPKRLNLPSGRKLAGVELKRFLKVRDALELRYAAMPVSAQVAGTCGVC
jgi:murein DD-endopeptidase MepM/ murein hydrolase activator NlpD